MIKILPPSAGGVGSITGQGAKIPHASWLKPKHKKEKLNNKRKQERGHKRMLKHWKKSSREDEKSWRELHVHLNKRQTSRKLQESNFFKATRAEVSK